MTLDEALRRQDEGKLWVKIQGKPCPVDHEGREGVMETRIDRESVCVAVRNSWGGIHARQRYHVSHLQPIDEPKTLPTPGETISLTVNASRPELAESFIEDFVTPDFHHPSGDGRVANWVSDTDGKGNYYLTGTFPEPLPTCADLAAAWLGDMSDAAKRKAFHERLEQGGNSVDYQRSFGNPKFKVAGLGFRAVVGSPDHMIEVS